MIRTGLLVLAALGSGGLLLSAARPPRPDDLADALPARSGAWSAAETREYDPRTIFEYLDGAGEVYRAYNFRRLLARRYERPGGAAIIADLFDMGSDRDAFGVFTHDLDGEPAGVGDGSLYKGGLLTLRQGSHFASVYAEEETPESRVAVLEIGRAIATALPGGGKVPDLAGLLPGEIEAARPAVRYFHTQPVLNYHFFVADANLLDLDATTEAVLGEYGRGTARRRVLAVRYPDEARAEKARAGFAAAYLPDAKGGAPVRTEDGRWTAAGRFGAVVTVVFGAGSDAEARELLAGVGRRAAPPGR